MMKKYLYLFMFAVMWGCMKEESIHPDLQLQNLYKIQDHPSDSVIHKVYQIYKTYGVPVFFNDTVGQVFVKTDVKGDSIFAYEKLDPAWGFTSYDGYTYHFDYMNDPGEQSKSLSVVESFLKQAGKVLYPYCILITNSYSTEDARGEINHYSAGAFKNKYRVLLITGGWETEDDRKAMPEKIIRECVIQKILIYKDYLEAFHKVSKEWLNQSWSSLGVPMPVGAPYYATCAPLAEDWWGVNSYTPEELEEIRVPLREKVGRFGFVFGDKKTKMYTPLDGNEDLNNFVKEVLRYSPEEFAAKWGKHALVMKKYEILYDLIENKLGVKL